MEEKTQTNQSEFAPAKNAEPKKPAIRTMESDIDKLFGETKPSLIQMMGKDNTASAIRQPVSLSAPWRTPKNIFALLLLILILLVSGGATGYLYFSRNSPPNNSPPKRDSAPLVPPPLFTTERVRIASASLDNPASLRQQIEDIVLTKEQEGTFTYIPVKLREGNQERFATAKDFLELYSAGPPADLLLSLDNVAMLFVYYSGDGPRFGFAFKSRDSARTLRGLLMWESSLLRDMTPLFFGETPVVIVAPFEDRTFRNIDWRFLSLSQTEDLGIAHSLFSSERIMLVATSKEAMETIIHRLYEGL